MTATGLAALAAAFATASAPAGAALHGLYFVPYLGDVHTDSFHWIDLDSRRSDHRYQHVKIRVLRRQDMDAVPLSPRDDPYKIGRKMRSIKPMRIEQWAADCHADTVQVDEFAGNSPTGLTSGWLVPERGSIGYEVLKFLCQRPKSLTQGGAQAVKNERPGARRAGPHAG